MNNRLKRRLVVVTGIIVIVVVSVLAIVGAATASKTVTVAEAASGEFNGSKVQVTGKVVDNSYSLDEGVLNFAIYDEEDGTRTQLKISYDKGVSATFGNQVTAICTGTISAEGVLKCVELVTKCPSKYESSVDALTPSQLLSYGEQIIGKPVKLTGELKAGTLSPVGQGDRFVLIEAGQAATDASPNVSADSTTTAQELSIRYEGALSDEIQGGSTLVLTGSLNASGRFEATDVALKG